MRAFTLQTGEIFIALTYPEFELLSEVVDMAANGTGCHRGAAYVSRKLANATSGVVSEALEAEEKAADQEEARASRRRRS